MIEIIADVLSRSLLWVFALTCLVALARYLVVAGAAWRLLWQDNTSRYMSKRLGVGKPPRDQVRREIAYSLLTCLMFPTSVFMTIALGELGLTRVYFYVEEFGWGYLVASVAMMIILHDALFYWTHRLLHTPWLMRHVHYVHHQSTDPTPWAAFSFHPVEGFLQVFNIVIIVMLIPAHPIALSAFLLLNVVGNVFGHCGFEFFSTGFRQGPLGRLLNTPSVHAWHHRRFRHNYCLYFTVWDRLMGTWRAPDTVPEFQQQGEKRQ